MLGKIISGRYRILERIGRGGMATVYKAHDYLLDRIIALKIMHPTVPNHSRRELIQRFLQEAKATASLSHPNIVQIYDIGTIGKSYYLVMEYIEGETLYSQMKKKGKFDIEEAVSIVTQVCDGLHHAHQHGVIHRDIKPENIMIMHNGVVKITDFGLSRILQKPSNLTQSNAIIGTVHYFSPEQAQGEEVGIASDLYSLGVILFEMVTGQVPFDAPQTVTIAVKHILHPVPNIRHLNKDLPKAFCHVIYKALKKDPSDRFGSAYEMKQALLNWNKRHTVVPVPSWNRMRRIRRASIFMFVGIFFFSLYGINFNKVNTQRTESQIWPVAYAYEKEELIWKQRINKNKENYSPSLDNTKQGDPLNPAAPQPKNPDSVKSQQPRKTQQPRSEPPASKQPPPQLPPKQPVNELPPAQPSPPKQPANEQPSPDQPSEQPSNKPLENKPSTVLTAEADLGLVNTDLGVGTTGVQTGLKVGKLFNLGLKL